MIRRSRPCKKSRTGPAHRFETEALRSGTRVATLPAVRILGVDLGSRRIGLAISDEEGEFAFPAGMIDSRGRKRDIAALRALILEREIGRAVVGLPIHMDGRRGPEAERSIRFAEDLGRAAGIPVETLDERWTSREAERLLEHVPGRRSARRREAGAVDEMAASILLRTYLARRAGKKRSEAHDALSHEARSDD
ncbi:MAG TPA: Holliday junction resolvase RuvX [Deltaproteobacteria bacterium]|nr:Holliday junction resolvase RuvX [Deltaproteobacteria bacterium]